MKTTITNLKFWLFSILLVNLKQKFVEGSLNIQKLFTEKEFLGFTKLFLRRKSFVREVRQVHVKKGKRKYTLLFVTTNEGTQRFNLGRHFDLTKGYMSGKPVIELSGRDVYGWQKMQQEKRLAAA